MECFFNKLSMIYITKDVYKWDSIVASEVFVINVKYFSVCRTCKTKVTLCLLLVQ